MNRNLKPETRERLRKAHAEATKRRIARHRGRLTKLEQKVEAMQRDNDSRRKELRRALSELK